MRQWIYPSGLLKKLQAGNKSSIAKREIQKVTEVKLLWNGVREINKPILPDKSGLKFHSFGA